MPRSVARIAPVPGLAVNMTIPHLRTASVVPSAWSTLLLSLLAIFLLTKIVRSALQSRFLPPGPRRYPLVGNALQLPRSHLWRRFTEWGEQYGTDSDSFVILLHISSTLIVL